MPRPVEPIATRNYFGCAGLPAIFFGAPILAVLPKAGISALAGYLNPLAMKVK
jgi:hypothetical protein